MDPDTRIGRGSGRFPTTRVSVVAALQAEDPASRHIAFESIVEVYWKPVYKYIRLKWYKPNEDAKDLTQAFFTRALEKDFLKGFDPKRAGFRTFLRTCLDGFLSNEAKAADRLKRGGGAEILSLDFETAEGELRAIDPPAQGSLEDFFHAEWVRQVLSLSVAELRTDCERRGQALQFRVFELYDLDPAERQPTYADIAAELLIPVTSVTNHLSASRRRFRQIAMEKLRQLTATDREYRSEVRAIFGTPAA